MYWYLAQLYTSRNCGKIKKKHIDETEKKKKVKQLDKAPLPFSPSPGVFLLKAFVDKVQEEEERGGKSPRTLRTNAAALAVAFGSSNIQNTKTIYVENGE
jgi:hypothetical protein